MEHARTLEPVAAAPPAPPAVADESPLARARLHRQLTVDEAARRASVSPEEIEWLEEGRLYRFPTPDRAIVVALLHATALGLDHREALELAGLDVPPLRPSRRRRLAAAGVFALVLLAAGLAVVLARSTSAAAPSVAAKGAALPAPWTIKVDVLNGSGDIVYTRAVASRVQSLSYRVTHVGKATSFNYPQTQVYYPPGGEAACTRLAKQLDVSVLPLPGGDDPLRCVVIVGPERGPTN
ncbi:MAG TPA: LytR C-terminal domain-containing protein [Gaiellaceae bacterium]|nr:LytR C-terminal domain-containing protein [Gaiellaceae bacterium]